MDSDQIIFVGFVSVVLGTWFVLWKPRSGGSGGSDIEGDDVDFSSDNCSSGDCGSGSD